MCEREKIVLVWEYGKVVWWEGGGVGRSNSCKRLHLCCNIWPATIRVAACFTPHIDSSRWGPRDGCIAGMGANLCSCRSAWCQLREAQVYKHFLHSPKVRDKRLKIVILVNKCRKNRCGTQMLKEERCRRRCVWEVNNRKKGKVCFPWKRYSSRRVGN